MLVRFLLLVWIVFSCSNALAAEEPFGARPEVKKFISEMVHKHHFIDSELIALFDDVKIRPAVIKSIRAPLEQKSWYIYQIAFVNKWRIHEGMEFWNKYRDVLKKAEKKYGVPASIIVATIGVETKYGKNTGSYRVIDALTNIAFSNSSRSKFFKSELEEFLLLVREERLDPRKVMGSYAGAIGQPQFMPSSYRRYAVNFSGNGKIDLSHNEADVIGSIANYYNKHGWKTDQPVTVKTALTSVKFKSIQGSYLKPADFGIKSMDNEKTKVIELSGYFGSEYWLGFHNFDVIKRYNSSNLYAMAVYQLSYYISILQRKTDNV